MLPQEGSYNAQKFRDLKLEYNAILTQAGTAAPTAVILDQDFEINFAYDGAGSYILSSPTIDFAANTFAVFIGVGEGSSDYSYGIESDGTDLTLASADIGTLSQVDDAITNLPISIKVIQ